MLFISHKEAFSGFLLTSVLLWDLPIGTPVKFKWWPSHSRNRLNAFRAFCIFVCSRHLALAEFLLILALSSLNTQVLWISCLEIWHWAVLLETPSWLWVHIQAGFSRPLILSILSFNICIEFRTHMYSFACTLLISTCQYDVLHKCENRSFRET